MVASQLVRGAPAPYLAANGYSIVCGRNNVSIVAHEGPIGIWHDWPDGFAELKVADLQTPGGCVLDLNSDLVLSWVEQLRGSFCWLCTVDAYSREHEYQDFSKSTSLSIIGTTSVIT